MVHSILNTYRTSLKVKLITHILLFALLSLGLLATLLIREGSQLLASSLESEQHALANSSAHMLSDWLADHQKDLTFITEEFDLDPESPMFAEMILGGILNSHYEYEDLFLANPSGDYISATGQSGNLQGYSFFAEALVNDTFVSNPLQFDTTSKWIIIITKTFTTRMGKVAILAASISVEQLAHLLESVKIGDKGYAYLLSPDKQFIYHPEVELIMHPDTLRDHPDFNAVIEEIFTEKVGHHEYTWNGETHAQSYVPVIGTDWFVAVTLPVKQYNTQLTGFRNIATIFIIISTGILVLSMYFIVHNLTRKLRNIQNFIEKAEKGDLTLQIANQELKPCWEIKSCTATLCPAYKNSNLRCWQIAGTLCNDEVQNDVQQKFETCKNCPTYAASCGDELTQLAESFNSLIHSQVATVQLVIQTAEDLASAAQELSATIEESNATVEEITAATEEITASSGQISSDLKLTATRLNQLTKISHETSESIGTVQGKNIEIEEQVSASEKNALDTEAKMLQITTETQTMYNHMQKLEAAAEEVKKIITAISHVAEQTNLLALNAQIEAARAGKEGLGFAVVANEINDLATKSSESANQISSILNNIQKQTTLVSNIMANEVQEINAGLTAVKDLRTRITTINHSLSIANQSIQTIAELAVAYVEKADETNNEIQTISQVIEDNVESFTMINDSLGEQSASFKEVSSAAQSLTEISEQLLASINYFKLP